MLLLFYPQCRTGPPLRFVCQCSNAKIQRSEHITKQISEFLSFLLSGGSVIEKGRKNEKVWKKACFGDRKMSKVHVFCHFRGL